MITSDFFHYAAAGRLGVWDLIPHPRQRQVFLEALSTTLTRHGRAILETQARAFNHTPDVDLASVLAVLDKLVTRGYPTFVDADFEERLLTDPALARSLCTRAYPEDSPLVGRMYQALLDTASPSDLVTSATDLLDMPYNERLAQCQVSQALPQERADLCSAEEHLFYEHFCRVFPLFKGRLRRQISIEELAEHGDDSGIVDFALQLANFPAVFEVDGSQHGKGAAPIRDEKRNKSLEDDGWPVFRIETEVVRNHLGTWFQEELPELCTLHNRFQETLGQYGIVTGEDLVRDSPLYRTAFYTIICPLAVHRCLRGLIHLFRYQRIPLQPAVRVLALEEDIPTVAEAFSQLLRLWDTLTVLAPRMPPAPTIHLHYLGAPPVVPLPAQDKLRVTQVARPQEPYDAVISHSFFLSERDRGPLEQLHPTRPERLVTTLRAATGGWEEGGLQHGAQPLAFELTEVEQTLLAQGAETSPPLGHPKVEALLDLLHLVFRKRQFRDGQLRVIARLLQRKPAIVLLPTGSGKSLTYQFSGLLLPGLTIVIDPLVSLMQDQVESLHLLGIDVVASLSSQVSRADQERIFTRMQRGQLAFLFIAPERLQSQAFRQELHAAVARYPISLAVIDEAHCISEWGHDFRPSYLHLPSNLQRYCADRTGAAPTLVGLTGTASFAVLTDIQLEMGIRDEEAIILPQSFDRPELRFEVRQIPMDSKAGELRLCKADIPRRLHTNHQTFYQLRGDQTNSGIVFCPHVNGSLGITQVADILRNLYYFSGEKPKSYRKQQPWNEYKQDTQRKFKDNHVQELIATKALGMGLDKPNIRYTIHYAMPPSVEAFYQEAGRAGRNGIPQWAYCGIIYSDDHWDTALDILNEPDHTRALRRLEAIPWEHRGDLLVQLWMLLKSYTGRQQEQERTFAFWQAQLAPVVQHIRPGATTTHAIRYSGDRGKETDERTLFRLMLLGIVDDYTIDYRMQCFEVRVCNRAPAEIQRHLQEYLRRYKFDSFAEQAVRCIPTNATASALEMAINVLINFIYDDIVAKRKQALRTMGELCRQFVSDHQFRDALLAYLQESEFSETLKEWLTKPFDTIGLEAIHALLHGVTTLDAAKRLIGTTRRLLDEDPQHIALRYVSVAARALSTGESDASVLQEADTLIRHIEGQRARLQDADKILHSLVDEVAQRRAHMREAMIELVLRRAGTAALARRYLKPPRDLAEPLQRACRLLVVANIVDTLSQCRFYASLDEETPHG